MSETWSDMTKRHRKERRKLVEDMASKRITQTVAAAQLGVSLTVLNNYIRRERVFWPVVRQGVKAE